MRESLLSFAASWARARDKVESKQDETESKRDEGESTERLGRGLPLRLVLPTDELLHIADGLAAEVEKQWTEEADRRQLRLPRPIPVSWCWAERGVASDVRIVVNDPPMRRPLFPPLPGIRPATADTVRAGGVPELFALYAGVDSGRVVVMGDYGRGKSGSAILVLRDALDHRRGLDAAQRAGVPVPVLLTAHGWDPRHDRLETWLARRLAKDYQTLRSDRDSEATARRLVRGGGVALFLDGFDEMDPTLHREALDDIGKQTTFRLVVLTRSEEFAAAVSASTHVRAAAVTELLPVAATDAAEYLADCQTAPISPPWGRLVKQLKDEPTSSLADALNSPLNLTLLRDAFPETSDIDGILVPNRFETPHEVESYLLDRIVDIAFPPDPDRAGPSREKMTLGRIAFHMNAQKTRDLAWWQMHRWTSPVPRVLATSILGVVIGALVGAATFSKIGKYAVGDRTGTMFGTAYLATLGLAFGFLAGLVSEFRDPRPTRPSRWNIVHSRTFNLSVALVGGLAVLVAVGNQAGFALGIPTGIAAGIAVGWTAARKRPGSTRTRRTYHAAVLARLDLPTGTVIALPVGLAYGLTEGPVPGLVTVLVTMTMFGLIAGFSRPSTGTEIGTDPQALWERERRSCLSFGLSAGLAFAVVSFVQNGVRNGPVAGLVAGTGFGLIVGLGCTIGASDAWRTALVFIQLRRSGIPVDGMCFLEKAHDRRILRTVGPLYQFRHPNLQDHLAQWYIDASGRQHDDCESTHEPAAIAP
ncbi:hypothetical protein [Pseudofrankia sp. BMG5.37]|uniref:hypothetical protein n=1 Tax=Pseudofrankia sp. BMG5.37 TaxID=3050035 RepID=UPI00289408F2|nr:hypothetical protein [Pseudofrankia sp. BMG5.37]MDT3444492.1 hypothetical protein [Pseudofrankia sp. BMG5.37]